MKLFQNCREFCARFKNEDTLSFCLRVMVGVIILYDHVHPVGAFSKNSGIDVSTPNVVFPTYVTPAVEFCWGGKGKEFCKHGLNAVIC